MTAADYKLVLCAGNNGSSSYQTATNTAYSKYPSGIFSFENYCGPAPDPAGNNAFLRIRDIAEGTSAEGAYGSISWTVPPWVEIRGAGGYIREPSGLSEGWRARFWGEGFDGSGANFLIQGAGVANGSLGGVGWGLCSTFCSHLWPFSGWGSYRRFIFEVTCFRATGCSRPGANVVDANSFVLTLADTYPVQLWLTNTTAPLLSGQWVRGNQTATYAWTDQGSGIRMEWVNIDGARQFTIDHASECDIGSSAVNGVFARSFVPCATASNIGRADTINTASLPDGAHTLQVCAQDFAQWQGLDGTGGASCQSATIRTDNTPPGAPAGLDVVSSNPARYLERFGARFGLPPNSGSPIVRVHYFITDAAGKVVVPEKVVSATEPSSLAGIEGPAKAGAYTLHVALEDEVGFLGPFATAAIPHDTTPPAAPQHLRVGPSTTRWNPRLDLAWHDIVDNGSPIDAVHYEIVDAAGKVVGSPHTVSGEGVEALHEIEAPAQRGAYEARVWLADEEGNVGAPASVPLPIDTTPPAAPQHLRVGPSTTRWNPRLDLAWHDITDDGSPIDAVHYEIVDAAGHVVGSPHAVTGVGVEALQGIEAPAQRGADEARVWLEDEEGNAGAPASVPLPIDTTPPAAPQDLAVTAPGVSRASQGFDVRWRDVTDDGSPIVAAHYRVEDGSGDVVVPTQTVKGEDVAAIQELDAPTQRGDYTLRLWLEDAEGNQGVAATAPLAYECVRSEASGGDAITSGLGEHEEGEQVVQQGEGSMLRGRLSGHGGGVGDASVCVFSSVVTEQGREFLGIAMTGADGSYRFGVPAGPSRELSAVYRSGTREVSGAATIETIVHPTFEARRKVVYNKHVARFTGTLPGPDNGRVVVVAQVRRGKGWLAFHRYRTRADGRVNIAYRFNKTFVATKYRMRLQVRTQSGYPYLQGNSDVLALIVRPKPAHRHRRRSR